MPKKSVKKLNPVPAELTVDQAMQFMEDARMLGSGTDEPTQAISLRVPKNVLRAFKTKALSEDRKYQSVIVGLMRKWITER